MGHARIRRASRQLRKNAAAGGKQTTTEEASPILRNLKRTYTY